MKNPEITSCLPDFKIVYDKETRVEMHFPREPAMLWFIAEIIREIDEFNMSYTSKKEARPKKEVKESTKSVGEKPNRN